MLISAGHTDRSLTEAEVHDLMAEALAQASRSAECSRRSLAGKRVLVIIPDGTRTAPIPLFFRLFHELLGDQVAALDYLVALGTHQPMDDATLSQLVGVEVRDGRAGPPHPHSHTPASSTTAGTCRGPSSHWVSCRPPRWSRSARAGSRWTYRCGSTG